MCLHVYLNGYLDGHYNIYLVLCRDVYLILRYNVHLTSRLAPPRVLLKYLLESVL
jgi:hypothetical protein